MQVKQNNEDFRTVTYNHMVDVAHSIENYAENAGGETGKDSDYCSKSHPISTSSFSVVLTLAADMMIKAARELQRAYKAKRDGDTKHGDYIADKKAVVQGYVDRCVSEINDLANDCASVRQELQAFQETCEEDQKNLGTYKKRLDDLLLGEQGDLQQLQFEVAKLSLEIQADVEELTQGKLPKDLLGNKTIDSLQIAKTGTKSMLISG